MLSEQVKEIEIYLKTKLEESDSNINNLKVFNYSSVTEKLFVYLDDNC